MQANLVSIYHSTENLFEMNKIQTFCILFISKSLYLITHTFSLGDVNTWLDTVNGGELRKVFLFFNIFGCQEMFDSIHVLKLVLNCYIVFS